MVLSGSASVSYSTERLRLESAAEYCKHVSFADSNQAFVDSLNERIAALSSAEDVRSSIDEVRSSDRFVGDASQLASISDDELADSLNTRIFDIVQNRQAGEGASSLSGEEPITFWTRKMISVTQDVAVKHCARNSAHIFEQMLQRS